MTTLSSEGYVVKDQTSNKYRLGIRMLNFSNIIKINLEIHAESLPILEELVERTGETAHVGILEHTNLVYLHKVEQKRLIRIFTELESKYLVMQLLEEKQS